MRLKECYERKYRTTLDNVKAEAYYLKAMLMSIVTN